MALLTLPQAAADRIVDSLMYLETSHSDVESPYSFIDSQIDFGGVRWRGLLTIGQIGWERPDTKTNFRARAEGYEIEAFVTDFQDRTNTLEVPVQRPSATLSAGAMIGAIKDNVITVAGDSAASATVGSMFRSGNRTWRVTGVDGLNWSVKPSGIVPAVGEAISGTTTVLGKIAINSQVLSPHLPSHVGPWVLPWVEAI